MANDRYVIDERRIMNSSWGQVWLEEDLVGEAYGIQAKCNFNKETVSMCGTMAQGHKVTSYNGTGSLKLRKTSSRMFGFVGCCPFILIISSFVIERTLSISD